MRRLDEVPDVVTRILIAIALAPLAAALTVGVLLSYGAWCAIDFVLPQKAEE